MQKIIHNLALLACLAALTVGLWRDWGVWLTLQRAVIAYLVFFGLGVVLILFLRSAGMESAFVRGSHLFRKVGK